MEERLPQVIPAVPIEEEVPAEPDHPGLPEADLAEGLLDLPGDLPDPLLDEAHPELQDAQLDPGIPDVPPRPLEGPSRGPAGPADPSPGEVVAALEEGELDGGGEEEEPLPEVPPRPYGIEAPQGVAGEARIHFPSGGLEDPERIAGTGGLHLLSSSHVIPLRA